MAPNPLPHLHYANLYLSLVPQEVRKAISADELNDRIAEATRLGAQASDPGLSAPLRQAAKDRAQAIMRAQPREATRRQRQELIAKAAAMPDQQRARRYRVSPARIMTRSPVAKAAEVAVYDERGRHLGVVDPDTIATPEEQARSTGPVSAAGTTGMGQPRQGGAQRSLPGDVPGRQVVKEAYPTPGRCRTVGDVARDRRLAKIEKTTGLDLTGRHRYSANPYSAQGFCICEAPAAHPARTGRTPVAKSAVSAWNPGSANRATGLWLAAQQRRR